VKTKPANPRTKKAKSPDGQLWDLLLYVMDATPKSQAAHANLRMICELHLKGRYRITVIDLLKKPHLARGHQILAIPTVIRLLPRPIRTIIGNLSDTQRMLVGMDLRPVA
jgi:circadian clock protein KaiB